MAYKIETIKLTFRYYLFTYKKGNNRNLLLLWMSFGKIRKEESSIYISQIFYERYLLKIIGEVYWGTIESLPNIFLQRRHINNKAILYIAFQHTFVSLINIFHGNHFHVRYNTVFGAIVKHLLCFGNAAY